ncbi:hypothetical protein C7271_15500 [filamentous cyanobacterium CCP5]|nr:hypothetical protein C7271_15500 [filamentous cyanobacterium CCP5]
MRLSFLGQSYEAPTPEIDTIETEATVTFLGRRTHIKQQQIAHRSHPSEELTYRGIRYSR